MRGTLVLVLVLLGGLLGQSSGVWAGNELVRAPILAGTWYEADAGKLSDQIHTFLKQAKAVDIQGELTAIVVPHAGHVYSGRVAASAFRLLEGRDIETVVMIGPSHHVRFSGVSVNLQDYQTPLGRVELDRDLAERIQKAGGVAYATRPEVHREEHCLEIELPFLQTVLPKAKIVPIIMGGFDLDTCGRLGDILARETVGKKVLLLCSTDLSHFYDGSQAEGLDHQLIKRVTAFDYGGVYTDLVTGQAEACGGFPLTAVMIAARQRGANRTELLDYAHSGQVTGDNRRVVGYMAVAFSHDPAFKSKAVETDMGVTPDGQKALLALARQSIMSVLDDRRFDMPTDLPACAQMKRGAFVTLKRYGVLRGCIGNLQGDRPLNQVVEEMAREAAFSDPRFRPLSKGELEGLSLEISVLTPYEPVKNIDEIQVGVHGLVMSKGSRRGLLLPQVPVEQGWTREEFLDSTCRKAGLSKGCWKDGADIYKFSAQVFGEEDALF